MTLRTDYLGTLDTKVVEAQTQGASVISTNLAAITSEMQTNANGGYKTFTVKVAIGYQPEDLRKEGNLWSAFRSGAESYIIGTENISGNEFTLTLDKLDDTVLYLDINFTF
jgi:hypothetical protein